MPKSRRDKVIALTQTKKKDREWKGGLIEQIRDIIVDINKQGVSVLLIEQNAMMALSIANYGYVMETGKIVMDGDAKKLLADDDVKEFYLGLHGDDAEKKSFRDVKHYKRRKRWAS